MQCAHNHFQQVFIHHLFANFASGRSEGKSRHSLVFICKYHVKTGGSSEQLTVALTKGPFPFCPPIACSGLDSRRRGRRAGCQGPCCALQVTAFGVGCGFVQVIHVLWRRRIPLEENLVIEVPTLCSIVIRCKTTHFKCSSSLSCHTSCFLQLFCIVSKIPTPALGIWDWKWE